MQMMLKDHFFFSLSFSTQALVGQKEGSVILQAAVFQRLSSAINWIFLVFFFTSSWSIDDQQLFVRNTSSI